MSAEPARPASVGVVIATRNRRETLLGTLDRLAGLVDRPPIVVVDNDSSDGTPEAVARRHPGVRVLRLAHNAGSAARNEGARLTGTELVAFSDDDSWWAPGSLETAERVFGAHPRLGLLAARIVVEPSGRLDPTCGVMGQSVITSLDASAGPPVLGFVACGAIVRRAAFLGVGGFHPRLMIGGEEDLLALDLAAAGWQLAYVDEVVAHHQPAPSGGRGERAALELRNGLWTAWLRRRTGGALRRTATLVRAAVRERRAATLAAALGGLPWVLRERRPVPPAVEEAARAIEIERTRRALPVAAPLSRVPEGHGHQPHRSAEASWRRRLSGYEGRDSRDRV